MSDLEAIKEHCNNAGLDFKTLVHHCYVVTQLGEGYKFTVEQLDDLYSGLVGGVWCNLGRGKTPELMEGIGPDPEDRNTLESWGKLRSELIFHGNSFYPQDEWLENNEESEEWVSYVKEAFMLDLKFEKDPEKWFVELREESKGE